MRIFNGFEQLTSISNAVLTIGTFDGVHVGHQKIIQQLNKEAEKIGGESVLLTFYPHPRMVLFPENHHLKLIQTQNEKLAALDFYGLKNVVVLHFTAEFANLTATEFVRDFLVEKLNVKKVVIGHDHQFGKNREGTLDFLRECSSTYHFEVIEIPAQEIDEVNISSTRIRNAIESGEIETVNRYLGKPFELNGIVSKGNQLGRTLGFPTANILVEDPIKIIPKNGVYAVEVEIPNHSLLHGMMNIGVRPTIEKELKQTIEVFIFDFESDIYDSSIKVNLISRIRDEQKFDSLEELTKQLTEDEKVSRSIFSVISR